MSQPVHNHTPPRVNEPLMPKGQCPACDAIHRYLTNIVLKERVRDVLYDGYPTKPVRSVADFDKLMDPLVENVVNAMREVLWPPGGKHTKGLLADPRRP